MANKDLDQIIKNKLDHVLPDNPTGDWDIFEQILSKNELKEKSEVSFDKVVSEKISQSTVQYVHDWSQMQHYLTIIDQRKQAVLIMKSLEAVIVCLILYTTSIITPNKSDIDRQKLNEPAITKQKVEMAVNHQKHADSEKGTNAKSNQNSVNSGFLSGPTENTIEIMKANTEVSLITNNVAFTTANNVFDQSIESISFTNGEKTISKSDIISIKENNRLNSVHLSEPNKEIGSNEIVETVKEDAITKGEAHSIEVILPIEHKSVESEFAYSFPMAMINPKSKKHWIIGAWTSADINTISTPYDKIFSLKAYQHVALNHSAGLSIGRKKDRLTLSSGLTYSRRNYQPRQFVEEYGAADIYYYESSLEEINYDLISIPCNIAYDFYKSKNWNIYGNVNATTNIIANADYGRRDELVLGRPTNSSNASLETNESRFDEKKFTLGVFNGSSTSDSYFVAAGIGLGIEKKISNNLSIYVEPSYMHHIFSKDIGIGPNKDRIHSTSLQLGVRSILL